MLKDNQRFFSSKRKSQNLLENRWSGGTSVSMLTLGNATPIAKHFENTATETLVSRHSIQ